MSFFPPMPSFHGWLPFDQFVDTALEDTIVRGVINQTFAPTRERTSRDNEGVFVYKDCADEVLSSKLHSGFFTEYHPSMFGEIADIIPYDGGIDVKFTCPAAMSAWDRAMYIEQVKVLESIIEVESREDGGEVVGSWFGGNNTVSGEGHTFTVRLPHGYSDWKADLHLSIGAMVGMWVQIVRFDREIQHCIHKTYRLMAEYFVVLRDTYP